MLKVLIAEDEQWIRKGLIKKIDWEGIGLQLAAEASDGEKGLALARLHQPEIILIDVRMPACDGLQLMKTLKKENYRPKFIIISGYTDFEYARTAITLGAFAYLLKPVQQEELNKTLEEACRAVRMEKEFERTLDLAARQLSVSMPVVKENIMLEILAGGGNDRLHQEAASFSPYYAVLVLGANNYLSIAASKEKADAVRCTILSRIGALLRDYQESIIFQRGENCFAIVIGLESNREYLHAAVAKRILRDFDSETFNVTIGVGNIYRDVVNIKRSYDDAVRAYQQKLIAGGNQILMVPPEVCRIPTPSDDHLKALQIAVELFDVREIRFGIQKLLNHLTRAHEAHYEAVRNLVSRIRDEVSVLAEYYRFDMVTPNLRDLLFIEGIECLTEYLTEALLELARRIAATKEAQGRNAAALAVEFIHLHYAEEITLDKLAKHVKLHPNYLSEVFKREIGANFTEYLMMVRIDKAKELLSQHNQIEIRQVAKLVGYTNSRYFSSLFAKRTGWKPTEFKMLSFNNRSESLDGDADEIRTKAYEIPLELDE